MNFGFAPQGGEHWTKHNRSRKHLEVRIPRKGGFENRGAGGLLSRALEVLGRKKERV